VIFVDTNVFMYAVGRAHPLKAAAREFFEASTSDEFPRLCTSTEVFQELLHAYLPVGRLGVYDAAVHLAEGRVAEIWPIEPDDVRLARDLVVKNPALGARDLLHFACCVRRGVSRVQSYDRALASCFAAPKGRPP